MCCLLLHFFIAHMIVQVTSGVNRQQKNGAPGATVFQLSAIRLKLSEEYLELLFLPVEYGNIRLFNSRVQSVGVYVLI